MTDKQIREAVARGQGRAIRFLRAKADQGYFDLILSLCLRDQTYDHWFESREDYMGRLVDTLPNPASLITPLGDRLFTSKNKRDRQQIRGILGHFREAGNAEARELLLKDFHRFRLKDRQFEDAIDLLGFEGLELLLGQAHRIEEVKLKLRFDDAVEQFGKQRTVRVFRKMLGPRAETILNWTRPKRPKEPKTDLTAAQCIERLQTGNFDEIYQFTRVAGEEDWKVLAGIVLDTTDKRVLQRARWLLSRRPWPLNVDESFKRALDERDPNLRFRRFHFLEALRSPMIRDWAIQQLTTKVSSGEKAIAFGLLRLNAEKRDLPTLTRAFNGLRHRKHDFHAAGFDVRDLSCGPTVEMLRMIYEFGPCGECRNSALRALVKRRAVTADMWAECLDDSDSDTRKLARKFAHIKQTLLKNSP